MAAIAGNRLITERTPSARAREEQQKHERSRSPFRGLLIAVPVGAAMWALIIWIVSLVFF